MTVTLYHCRDTRSFRALWALEEAGLPYSLVKMPFPPRYLFDGYLGINPLGTVPALVTDGVLMTESAAICQYVAGLAGEGGLAVSPGEADYPLYLNWLHRSDATLTFPLTLVLRYGRLETPEKRQPVVVDDYSRWFLKRAEAIETALQTRDYLCAGRFTVADICVAYPIFFAERLGLADQLGERSRAYLGRLQERPGHRRAVEAQRDMAPVI